MVCDLFLKPKVGLLHGVSGSMSPEIWKQGLRRMKVASDDYVVRKAHLPLQLSSPWRPTHCAALGSTGDGWEEDSKVSPKWGYCNTASVFFAVADAQMLTVWFGLMGELMISSSLCLSLHSSTPGPPSIALITDTGDSLASWLPHFLSAPDLWPKGALPSRKTPGKDPFKDNSSPAVISNMPCSGLGMG